MKQVITCLSILVGAFLISSCGNQNTFEIYSNVVNPNSTQMGAKFYRLPKDVAGLTVNVSKISNGVTTLIVSHKIAETSRSAIILSSVFWVDDLSSQSFMLSSKMGGTTPIHSVSLQEGETLHGVNSNVSNGSCVGSPFLLDCFMVRKPGAPKEVGVYPDHLTGQTKPLLNFTSKYPQIEYYTITID